MKLISYLFLCVFISTIGCTPSFKKKEVQDVSIQTPEDLNEMEDEFLRTVSIALGNKDTDKLLERVYEISEGEARYTHKAFFELAMRKGIESMSFERIQESPKGDYSLKATHVLNMNVKSPNTYWKNNKSLLVGERNGLLLFVMAYKDGRGVAVDAPEQ